MQNRDTPSATGSWDTYWEGAGTSSSFTGGGSSHPLVLSFWTEYFTAAADRFDDPAILDIASGNGAVVECAKAAFDGQLSSVTCLDISPSAIAMLEQRFPELRGVVADAAAMPFDAASFDIATSQFGIEYADAGAIDELCRVVKPGGNIALLLHHGEGMIHAQCAASRDAIGKMQQARFIPLCIQTFEAGYEMLRGGDKGHYQAEVKNLTPAIRAMEAIMSEYGRDVADSTIVRLYRDVRTMLQRIGHYEPAEVLDWFRRMDSEIDAYAGRMSSMCEAAIDAGGFESLQQKLIAHGFELLRSDTLVAPEHSLPLAWAVIAAKQKQ